MIIHKLKNKKIKIHTSYIHHKLKIIVKRLSTSKNKDPKVFCTVSISPFSQETRKKNCIIHSCFRLSSGTMIPP